jgi:hypothetical protein
MKNEAMDYGLSEGEILAFCVRGVVAKFGLDSS